MQTQRNTIHLDGLNKYIYNTHIYIYKYKSNRDGNSSTRMWSKLRAFLLMYLLTLFIALQIFCVAFCLSVCLLYCWQFLVSAAICYWKLANSKFNFTENPIWTRKERRSTLLWAQIEFGGLSGQRGVCVMRVWTRCWQLAAGSWQLFA